MTDVGDFTGNFLAAVKLEKGWTVGRLVFSSLQLGNFDWMESHVICSKIGVRKIGALGWFSEEQMQGVFKRFGVEDWEGKTLNNAHVIVFSCGRVLVHPDYVAKVLRRAISLFLVKDKIGAIKRDYEF